jgi:hypothetical protein
MAKASNKHNPLGWRVQLCTGLALALMAVAAVRVDLINNWEYGQTVSPEMATILVLAAVGVVSLPTAGAILGWNRHLKWTCVVCVVLTVWAAINAYSTKQGAHILESVSQAQTYEAALADQKAARETLARITETGDAEELQKLQTSLGATRATACKHPKSEECKLAELNERTITQRLSDAKSRDRSQAILDKAKVEAKAGPAEVSMVASVIARQTGSDAASVARIIALALTGLGIAVTQALALLGGYSASLIGSAFKARPVRQKVPSPKGKAASKAAVYQRAYRERKKATLRVVK